MFILEWLLKVLLDWLLSKATGEAARVAAELGKQAERGEVNAETIKAYEESTARTDRIRAAGNLLNRNRVAK